MNDLLMSKGFRLTYCDISHNSYYEYVDENANEYTNEIARLFGIDEDQDVNCLIIQCDTKFSDCKVAADDLVWSVTEEEFFDKVRLM